MERYYEVLTVLEAMPKSYERDMIIAATLTQMEIELQEKEWEPIELKRGA